MGFECFAKEHDGNACIMVRNTDEDSDHGRMIIDTAASKLFLEFGEDGTARWISNAAVWLCNTERYSMMLEMDEKAKTGIDMTEFDAGRVRKQAFEKREVLTKGTTDFALTIIIDNTGSMSSAIEEAKETVCKLLKELENVKKQKNVNGRIVGQVIQYMDYSDSSRYDNNTSFSENFNIMRQRLTKFNANGGGGSGGLCGGMCEDIQYGFECALKNIEKAEFADFYHFIVVIGDYCCHGDNPSERCYGKNHPKHGIPLTSVWMNICNRLKRINNFKVCFIPMDNENIHLTFNRLHGNEYLGENVEKKASISSSELSSVLISETIRNYRIGIS